VNRLELMAVDSAVNEVMTPERWQQASRIFEGALEREPEARRAFLGHACGDDEELRHEVESLLANKGTSALIDLSIWDLADNLLPADVGLATGAQVGSCRIEGVLGAGGMGQVDRARDTKLNRDVALKVLPDLFTDDPERLALFTREAHMLASLNPLASPPSTVSKTRAACMRSCSSSSTVRHSQTVSNVDRFRWMKRFRSPARSPRPSRPHTIEASFIAISSPPMSKSRTMGP
jgi:hypothetical protein